MSFVEAIVASIASADPATLILAVAVLVVSMAGFLVAGYLIIKEISKIARDNWKRRRESLPKSSESHFTNWPEGRNSLSPDLIKIRHGKFG